MRYNLYYAKEKTYIMKGSIVRSDDPITINYGSSFPHLCLLKGFPLGLFEENEQNGSSVLVEGRFCYHHGKYFSLIILA